MAISVIVSNFNGARYLPRLIETLKAQQRVKLELIVVDRYSTDDSAAILAQHPDINVVKEPPESGLVAGYAVGTLNAQYDNFFFCNEDIWIAPDCLHQVEEQLNAGTRVGAVMPVQLTYDGKEVVNAGHWFMPSLWNRENSYPFRASMAKHLDTPTIISGINAGACLVRRSAYEAVGGWDTSFFLDFEDTDLSIRLWQQGWLCRVVPSALVYHAVGASNAMLIHGGRSTVGTKRYVCAVSNQLVVCLKTFTGIPFVFLPFLLWTDRFVRDVVKLRWNRVILDLDAAWLTLRRAGAVVNFRRTNQEWNRKRPGQRWYQEPEFSLYD